MDLSYKVLKKMAKDNKIILSYLKNGKQKQKTKQEIVNRLIKKKILKKTKYFYGMNKRNLIIELCRLQIDFKLCDTKKVLIKKLIDGNDKIFILSFD